MSGLTPAFIEALGRLELVVRRGLHRGMRGEHTSQQKGHGIEIADHRSYSPGDDLRFLDWAAYARQGRPIIKETLEESDLALTVVVDASASMALPEGSSSMTLATDLALALSVIALRRHNRAGLLLVQEKQTIYIPPSRGETQLARIQRALQSLGPEGKTPLAAHIVQHCSTKRPEGLVWVISDLYDQEEPHHVIDALVHFGLDGGVICIRNEEEVERFPIGPIQLVDVETRQPLHLVMTPQRRAAMQESVRQWHLALMGYAHNRGVSLVEAPIQKSVQHLLLDWARQGLVVKT